MDFDAKCARLHTEREFILRRFGSPCDASPFCAFLSTQKFEPKHHHPLEHYVQDFSFKCNQPPVRSNSTRSFFCVLLVSRLKFIYDNEPGCACPLELNPAACFCR